MLAVQNPVTKQSDPSFNSCKLQAASCKSAQAFSIVGTPGDLGDLWQGPRPVM
jgi:hypothetical protein